MTPEVSDITFSFHSKQCPPSEVEVGGGVYVPIGVLVSASLDEQFISKVEVYTPSETEEALFFPFRSIGAYLI